jgi:spore germination cell wall hydrolase CwlJ-like protein
MIAPGTALERLSHAEAFMLALLIWRESRGESAVCRTAVGCSVLNRVRRPKWWGDSVLTVAAKRLQYSSLTAPRDTQLVLWPTPFDPSWEACHVLAYDLLTKPMSNPVPGADSFYDCSIAAPSWTIGARHCGDFGRLSFWDVDHDYEAEVVKLSGSDTRESSKEA